MFYTSFMIFCTVFTSIYVLTKIYYGSICQSNTSRDVGLGILFGGISVLLLDYGTSTLQPLAYMPFVLLVFVGARVPTYIAVSFVSAYLIAVAHPLSFLPLIAVLLYDLFQVRGRIQHSLLAHILTLNGFGLMILLMILRYADESMSTSLTALFQQTLLPVLFTTLSFLYLMSERQGRLVRLNAYQHLAERDTLTGLPNRYAWELQAERMAKQASVYHLLTLDLDQFKQVNDRYGHLNGDAVLEQFSMILEQNTRQADIVARMGGEEFSVLLTDLPTEQVWQIAERIRSEVEQHTFRLLDGSSIHVTTSIGLSSGKQDIPVQHSMELSDKALYQAKRSGRNLVRIASHLL